MAAKSSKVHLRCPECVVAQQAGKNSAYRLCGFHPSTGIFVADNARCATLSKLRWVLIAHGVPLLHSETSGLVSSYSMGLADGGRLFGAWVKGNPKTLLMCVVKDGGVSAITLPQAQQIIAEYSPSLSGEATNLSVGWTR